MIAKLFIFTLGFTITIYLNSCGQNSSPKTVSHFYSAEQIARKLEIAFSKKSVDSLNAIFAEWNNFLESNADSFMRKNDTLKAVFDIYKQFYKPFDLLQLGRWEWGNDLNANAKYAVVQNRIFFSIMPSDSFDNFNNAASRKDSIVNFRPSLNLGKSKILYLTSEYEKAMNNFLGTESSKLGEGGIMNPSMAKGESENRFEFIRPYIPVLHGHWGGYWHIATHPEVSLIIFNNSFTKAQILFRVGYQGGEAAAERSGGMWTLKESRETWIE